jgi:hypothetical protein
MKIFLPHWLGVTLAAAVAAIAAVLSVVALWCDMLTPIGALLVMAGWGLLPPWWFHCERRLWRRVKASHQTIWKELWVGIGLLILTLAAGTVEERRKQHRPCCSSQNTLEKSGNGMTHGR